MWVLPVDRTKIPRASLPPGRYDLPWYLTSDEVARYAELLVVVLHEVSRCVLVPWAAAEEIARAPLSEASASAVVLYGIAPADAEQVVARIACRYLLVQWSTPREFGYGWQEQHVKPLLAVAVRRELGDPNHPLRALGVQATPVNSAAALTPDPLEMVELLEATVAHRLQRAKEGLSKADYLRSLHVVAGQRLAARLLRLPTESLQPALEVLLVGEDGPLDDARAQSGAEALEKIGLARVAGRDLALGPLARAASGAQLREAMVEALPREAWSLKARGSIAQHVGPPILAKTAPTGEHDGVIFAWIHLADLHFGQQAAYGSAYHHTLLNALREDIGEVISRERLWVDAIFVTGDIAYTGQEREYAAAHDWFSDVAKHVGIGPERIFLVPGNHDVDRAARQDRDIMRLLRRLRQGTESLDDALTDVRDRAGLLRGMRHYLAFAHDYGAGEVPYWAQQLHEGGGLRVRVAGLNTALLSGGDDEGRLRLGETQLATALSGASRDELLILLSHHPFNGGWLADEPEANRWAARHAHIHLSSHAHHREPKESHFAGGGHIVEISAGGVLNHGDAVPSDYSYNVGAVVATRQGALSLRVWSREWSDRRRRFRVVPRSTPPDHPFAELRLRVPSTGASREPVAQAPPLAPVHASSGLERSAIFEGPGGVPISPVPYFSGREQELVDLRAALAGSDAACVVGTGFGGIGKTSLVRQFVATEAPTAFPDGSIWIDGSSLEADIARAVKRFGLTSDRPPAAAEAAAFLTRVLHDRRVLVVIDDVDPDGLDPHTLPIAGGSSRTIITSRSVVLHQLLNVSARPLLIGRWSVETSRSYLRSVVPTLAPELDADLDALAELVDGFPLFLEILAQSLRRPGMTPARMLERLKREIGSGTDRTLAATLMIAYQGLDDAQRRVLLALAACARITSGATVARVAGMSSEEAAERLADLAARALVEYVDGETGRWMLHEVVRLFARQQAGIAQADEAHLALVREHLKAHEDPLDWQGTEEGMDEVLAAVDQLVGAGDARAAADLLNAASVHLFRRGRYAEFVERGEQVVPQLPQESESLASVLGNLGLCYARLRGPAEAIEYQRRALTIFEKLQNLAGQANTLNNLANALQRHGDIGDAIKYYQRALDIYYKTEPRREAGILNNLGMVYLRLDDRGKAAESLQRALMASEQGGDLEGQATALGNLGILYQHQRDIPKAIESHQRSLEIFEALGQLAGQASELSNLGLSYQVQNDIPKAMDHYQRSLSIFEKLGQLGSQADQIGNLGLCFRALGDLPKAIEHHERALALHEELGQRDGQAKDLYNLGMCYAAQGESSRARDHHQRALDILRGTSVPDEQPMVRAVLDALADLEPAGKQSV